MERSPGRRRFLKSVTALTAVGLPVTGVAADARSQHPEHGAREKHGAQPATVLQAYSYFTQTEATFVEGAVSCLIPADDLGPGAKEAGVAYFIDQQLDGAWGAHARTYRLGPWPEGTPTQGDQSLLTPREVYRTAIAEIQRYCSAKYGNAFDALVAAQQDEVLRDLQEGKISLELVPARLFFGMLWANTQQGFFADPMYGGNRDKIGWKLVGFPGVAAVYTEFIEKHNQAYRAVPVSIADVQQGLARVDEHGHPVHVLLSEND
ncbi:gluconate 2-dehydrogenase subunit 3 family protein [Paraburkholderia aromaticivorans]|uniref:gluconate 2-dehydrogenase subunit 3 family protein n=1 Tax=Paraburkholderia aromaticivorans TaxID=2026199 RepID=UPI001455F768|nr:gluconate 2-dehydrogenase subunit 3 family protein [Paraburkholderia aromaticivorans]